MRKRALDAESKLLLQLQKTESDLLDEQAARMVPLEFLVADQKDERRKLMNQTGNLESGRNNALEELAVQTGAI